MAVRFSASGQHYTRTLSLGSQSNYSVGCWIRLAADRNDYSTFWAVDSGTNAFMLQTDATGTQLTLWDDPIGGVLANGPNMVVGVWYFVIMSVAGTAGVLRYRTLSSPTWTTATWTGEARTLNSLDIGTNRYSEWVNGDVAALKLWTKGLTAADGTCESYRYAPAVTAGLQVDYPFFRADILDSSGNARTLSGGAGASTEDGPPIPLRVYAPRTILQVPAGGQSAILGQVSETDTAQPVARSKAQALGQVTETDTAQSVTTVRSAVLGQPAESDTAQPLGRVKARVLGQPSETGTAQAVTVSGATVVGQVTEADSAQPLGRAKAELLGQVTETNTAQGLSRSKTTVLGQASETGTAQPVGRVKAATIGQPAESDTAGALLRLHVITISQVTETDLAQALGRAKAAVLGQVTETDVAALLTVGGAGGGLPGQIGGPPTSLGSVVQPVVRSLIGAIE